MRRVVRIALRWGAAAVALGAIVGLVDVGVALGIANQPARGFALPAACQSRGPLNILVLGDSLAFGYHASTKEAGFVSLLARKLARQRPGSLVFNVSAPGASMGDMPDQLHRSAGRPIDAVVVVAGANDIRKLTNPAVFAIRERTLLDDVHAAYPEAPVLISNIPDVSARYFTLRPIRIRTHVAVPFRMPLTALIALDNEISNLTAARFDATVVDLHALSKMNGADSPRFISADGLHPNDAGHERIAQFIWPTLARVSGIAK